MQGWSSGHTVVATRGDGALDITSVGIWFDGSEVLARQDSLDGFDFIEILDVDDCVLVGAEEGIEAWGAVSFTTDAEGLPSSLLYLYDVDARLVGYSIRECDLTFPAASCYVTLYEGVKSPNLSYLGVDSAD